jgi:hypothetical protein
MYAAGKSKLLFVVGDGKSILDKLNAGTLVRVNKQLDEGRLRKNLFDSSIQNG